MLDYIISYSIRNKLIIGLMTVALIVWGVWSATKLPIDAVPDITNNQVQIITLCPTLAGQEVEQLVTYPIEQSIANLPDLVELRSISRFGLSVITAVFDDKVDIYFARQLINEKIKEAEEKIPPGIGRPELAPVSTGLGEVYQYIIHPKKGSEDKYTPMDLRTMQDWIVARQLYGTPGIAEVNSFGGQLKQYEVSLDPDRLLAMDVSIPEIFTALEKNNENTGGAYIDKKPNAYFIRGVGLINSFEDIKSIVVKNSPNGIPILIKDVAEVQLGSAIRYGALTYNGQVDAVGGVVMMLKGGNSADVVKRIKLKMETIQQSLPDDVLLEPYLDRTDLVNRAISTVEKNLIEGALIVVFVLVLFLGNLRAGLIVASAIPLSLLFALGLMNVFGVSANLMSLGAIDFGLIVDGAVIIVESIFHSITTTKLQGSNNRLTAAQMDETVFASARRMMNSAVFGQAIILIVYLPIFSLVGIEGKMFGPMAQTVSFAIIGAFILSLTYIPMVSSLFLSKNVKPTGNISDRMMNAFHRIYAPLLQMAIRFKMLVVILTLLLFAFSLILFLRMGGEFIPKLQEGDFAFHCILPQGSSLTQSVETSMQAARLIKQFDEVKMVVGKTGSAEVPTDPMPPEATDMIIILHPIETWKSKQTYDELADAMMEELENIPGVFFEKNQPIQMRFNELMTGIRQDVAVKIYGENMDTLLAYGNKVAAVVQKVNGASAPQVERINGLPQIAIRYNRAQIANYGLAIDDINHIVSTAFAGGKAGVVFENESKFDLVIRLDSTHRKNLEDVSHLYIPAKNGAQIPLSQVADINMELGPAQISRENGKRRIVVGFNVTDRDVESVVSDIQTQLKNEVALPEGYYTTYGGTFENLQAASQRLMVAVPVALALIFILLYFTFHSISQAALIFTAIPMSAIGGVFALYLRDMPFSISAGVGFIALFGVAVLNGIVLVSTFNQLAADGMGDIVQRVKHGTKIRLRPVLMTATVASFGFLPMALSHGAGAEVQKPLATVVIGGLLTATFLTLFVLPLLYMLFSSSVKAKPTLAAAILLFCSFTSINAQNNPTQTIASTLPSMTADQAVAIALENSLQLKSQQYDLESNLSLQKASFTLPRMGFDFQYGQMNSIVSDNGFSVLQTIPFPTAFSAKSDLLEAEAEGSRLHQQVTAQEIKTQVLSYFYQLVYLQQKHVKLKQLDSLYADFVIASTHRYEAGETSLIGKTTAETKRGEITLMVQQNTSAMKSVYRSLKTMMNTATDFTVDDDAFMVPLTLSEEIDSTVSLSNPFIKAYYQQALIAGQSIKVEKKQNLPEISVGYFNQSIIGTQNIGGNDIYYDGGKRFQGFNVGLGIPLTLGSNSSRVKSLEYKQQSLEKEAEYQNLSLQTEIQNALLQYDQSLSQYTYYKNTAMSNAKQIIEAAQLSFTKGGMDYMEYAHALQTSSEVELKYLESIHKVNQAVIHILYLTQYN